MSDQRPWDLVVVGGGAAGFFAAISCAESHPGARVLILEKSSHVLGKVKISGGGRCNVTHACYEPKPLAQHYPRGSRALIGPFTRWSAQDTVDWFQSRGVELKTELDGRMFPTTDNSGTIIDCLTDSAAQVGIVVRTSTGVQSISEQASSPDRFIITTDHGEELHGHSLLLATGGTRLAAGARLAQSLGHELIPNVPSLFAFNINDDRINSLPGVSVPNAAVSLVGIDLKADGPLLITHHGLSGPGILKLSAWGARELNELDYKFTITINWIAGHDITRALDQARAKHGKRMVCSRAPFDDFPKRLWRCLCEAADIKADCTWSQISKENINRLSKELTHGEFKVDGKSMNKDEFVTCGGVKLNDVDMRTLESKIVPGLYFAGEVLDIDGITGGFNFQNAWTTGHLAGGAIAEKIQHEA